jgi:hypothetical protein
MLAWESSRPGTLRRWAAWGLWLLAGVLLVNSMERTSMVIVGLWWAFVLYHRRGRPPLGVLAVMAAGFTAMTLVLHGVSLAVLRNQIFRRLAIVNAMVNYFVFERYPADHGYLLGSSYSGYLLEGVLGSGQTFAKELIGQLFPGQDIGTAPVGALTEAWANFGVLFVVAMAAQGLVFAAIDDRLRHRTGDPLGRVFFAGLTLLLATTAYGGLLSVALAGGVLPLTILYLVVRGRTGGPSTEPTRDAGDRQPAPLPGG